jgi:hypothetical protein
MAGVQMEGDDGRPLAAQILSEFKTLRDKLKNDDDTDGRG